MLPALQQASQHDWATPAAQQVLYPCCFDGQVSASGESTALIMCTTPFVQRASTALWIRSSP